MKKSRRVISFKRRSSPATIGNFLIRKFILESWTAYVSSDGDCCFHHQGQQLRWSHRDGQISVWQYRALPKSGGISSSHDRVVWKRGGLRRSWIDGCNLMISSQSTPIQRYPHSERKISPYNGRTSQPLPSDRLISEPDRRPVSDVGRATGFLGSLSTVGIWNSRSIHPMLRVLDWRRRRWCRWSSGSVLRAQLLGTLNSSDDDITGRHGEWRQTWFIYYKMNSLGIIYISIHSCIHSINDIINRRPFSRQTLLNHLVLSNRSLCVVDWWYEILTGILLRKEI